MGMFFTNLHIRRTDALQPSDLIAFLRARMEADGYIPADDGNDAEVSVIIYAPKGSQWISVASDTFEIDDDDGFRALAMPFAERFNTFAIAAMCIDSDFMMLNLLSAAGDDGWINIGQTYDQPFPRRSRFAPWKKVVTDMDAFKKAIRQFTGFAEESFGQAAPMLGMEPDQCIINTRYDYDLEGEGLTTLHYRRPASAQKTLPRFDHHLISGMPCMIDQPHFVGACNKGGPSKGIAIQFEGKWVENDLLTIENAGLRYQKGRDVAFDPIELNKVRTESGEYVLRYENRDFPIPPAVDPSLPPMRRDRLESERFFGVNFRTQGDPRKVLDVKVRILPLEAPQNGMCWYVWMRHNSKREWIEWNNKLHTNDPFFQLDPDDFDLDD